MKASPSQFAPKNSGSREQKPVSPQRIGTPSNRPRMKSEAQRMLWDVTDSLSTIAKNVGAGGKATVAHWRSGARKPDDVKRRKLAKAYGIPAQAWDERAEGELEEDEEDDDEIEDGPARLVGISTDHFLELIHEARELRKGRKLSPGERLKAISEERALLAQYLRTQERERHIEELVVRTHPHWQRFEDLLLKALSPFPDAMRAVVEAIEKSSL